MRETFIIHRVYGKIKQYYIFVITNKYTAIYYRLHTDLVDNIWEWSKWVGPIEKARLQYENRLEGGFVRIDNLPTKVQEQIGGLY